MASQRDNERLSQGPGAVLSLTRAAELLPLSDAKARRWLRDEGLVRSLVAAEVVIWADVLDHIRSGGGAAQEPQEPQESCPPTSKVRRSGLRRVKL